VYVKNKPSSYKKIVERGTDSLKLNGTTLTFAYSGGSIDITTDFPLQKWVYIIVNVVNGTIVEVYLNGKLVITKQVAVATISAKNNLKYGEASGIVGYITKLKRDPVALTPDEAWKTYLEGNGLASFSNFLAGYNASFSLYNTEGTIKEYTAL
jgi:hypothetical protein